jgi:hypothetical protein
VFVTGDSIIGWNKNTKSSQWAHCITNSPHIGPVSSYRKPVIADIDGDGDVEIIVFYFDNRGNGATTLDIFTHNGSLLARRNFADCSYPTAIAVGDFVKGTGHNGLEMHNIILFHTLIHKLDILFICPGVFNRKSRCHRFGLCLSCNGGNS